MSAKDFANIEKLTKDNYSKWKRIVSANFLTIDAIELVEGTDPHYDREPDLAYLGLRSNTFGLSKVGIEIGAEDCICFFDLTSSAVHLLMRLKALVTTLPSFSRSSVSYENLVTALENLDIATAEDMVLRYSSEELLHRLVAAKVDSCDFPKLYEEVVASFTPEPVLGDELCATERERRSGLKDPPQVGALSVDSILRLPSFGLVEVAGLTSTGKTLFVKQTILRYLLRYPTATAHWIDPLGVFSPERANQMARQLIGESHAEIEDPLTRLHVVSCADLASVYDILEQIAMTLKDAGDGNPRARFVVIDPVTPLLGPGLTNESAKGHAHMVTFMRHLSSMSQHYGLTFFLVNTATKVLPPPLKPGATPLPPTYKPSLGPSYAYLTDISLFLSRLPSSSWRDVKAEFKLQVIKIRSVPTPRSCHFRIDGNGLIV